jgi:DNA-binding transcriptional LysR family regulator
MCVRLEVERGLLVEVKIRQMHLPRHLYLVHRRGEKLSHAAHALLRLLRAGSQAA